MTPFPSDALSVIVFACAEVELAIDPTPEGWEVLVAAEAMLAAIDAYRRKNGTAKLPSAILPPSP